MNTGQVGGVYRFIEGGTVQVICGTLMAPYGL